MLSDLEGTRNAVAFFSDDSPLPSILLLLLLEL
jgi:hypothetical protein